VPSLAFEERHMKLSLSWKSPFRRAAAITLCVSSVVIACASTETIDSTPPPVTPPESKVVVPPPPEETSDGAASPRPGTGTSDGGLISLTCGDGKTGSGEECDDGNNASNDGCSASCKLESSGPNDICPGTPITLTGTGTATRTGSVTGTTASNYPQYLGTCGGNSGKEAVYVLTPEVSGLVTATLTASFDAVLYARRTCDDVKTQTACQNLGSNGGEKISFVVTKDQPVYLFVDGASTTPGTFTLDVQLATAFCGNGVAETPETCDDGNTVDGDGCSSTCTFEPGDGTILDCPGQPIALNGASDAGVSPRVISFAGTTTGLPTSTVAATGCSAGGPNALYAITPDVSGSMKAKLVASYDNAALHIRAECDTVTVHSQLDCREATEPFENLELTVPVIAGRPYYVIVDSSGSTYNGPYNLDVVVTPGGCGNAVLDGAEQCDDGNAISGDGCTSTCTLEPIPSTTDTCPGTPLAVAPAGDGTYVGVITSSTATLTSNYKPKTAFDGCSTTVLAKDAVYTVTAPINGLLTATVKGTFDSVIYARTGCDEDAAAFTDLGCSGQFDGNAAETITVPILANTPLFLVVDGEVATAEGLFELDVTVTPSICGNGHLEGGETCDDGNAVAGDGCDAACLLEPATSHDTCQNAAAITLAPAANGTFAASVSSGTTNLTHDQTFTGCTSAGADAIYTVVAPISGVMSVEVPVASFNVSLGARSTCPASTTASVPIACSNASSENGLESINFSVVQGTTYYVIVDGTAAAERGTFTMLVNVRPPGCGDGLLSGNEQCDDGNLVNGDGCSETCTVEPLAGLDTCPGYTLPLTGTGNEPRLGVVTIDTSALTANYAGSCGGSSKDGVVVVTPPITGTMSVKLTGMNYQPVLFARTNCTNATSEPFTGTSTSAKACDDDQPNPSTQVREFVVKVTAGTPYYLFVDGYLGSAGVARLNVTVTP
jgi:cysteine-rich repeat protein